LENLDLPGLAAVYQLKDLDSFIANTAVPPPPSHDHSNSGSNGLMTGSFHEESDLSAFIIPPPPTAKRSNSELSSSASSPLPINGKAEKVSPLIASIQQKLLSPTAEAANKEFVSIRPKELATIIAVGGRKKDASPPPPPPRTSFPPPGKLEKPQPINTYQFGAAAAEHESTNGGANRVSMKLPLKSGSPPNSPYKLSLTSSSDSISSSASVNTVKSVSPVDDETDSDGPPSLPPRLSPVKSMPMTITNGIDLTVKSKSIMDVGSPKPALPARAVKIFNGNFSNNRKTLPQVPGNKPSTQKTVVKIKENGDHHCTSPTPPELPQKTLAGRKLPLSPPPPPPPAKTNGHGGGPQLGVSGAPLRINQPNGGGGMVNPMLRPANELTNGHHNHVVISEPEIYSNSEFDPDEDSSLEGTSVDDDDQSAAAANGDHIEVFRKAEEVVERVVAGIAESQQICKKESGSRYVLRLLILLL
jgi:hypothetical protein